MSRVRLPMVPWSELPHDVDLPPRDPLAWSKPAFVPQVCSCFTVLLGPALPYNLQESSTFSSSTSASTTITRTIVLPHYRQAFLTLIYHSTLRFQYTASQSIGTLLFHDGVYQDSAPLISPRHQRSVKLYTHPQAQHVFQRLSPRHVTSPRYPWPRPQSSRTIEGPDRPVRRLHHGQLGL